MFNPFRRKTILDNAKDFQKEFDVAKIISFKYLDAWFQQSFQSPELKHIFKENPNMHTAMAAEVVRYLFADKDTRGIGELKDKEEVEMAKTHAPKWADDTLKRDKEFCELVIQSLRMDFIFFEHFKGKMEQDDEHIQKVKKILEQYGGLVTKSPDPGYYSRLIMKWIDWDKKYDKEKTGPNH